jgi:hypothetical protein
MFNRETHSLIPRIKVEEVSGGWEVGTSSPKEERGKIWETPPKVSNYISSSVVLLSTKLDKWLKIVKNCHLLSLTQRVEKKKSKYHLLLLLLLLVFCHFLSLSLCFFCKKKAMDPTNTLHNLLNKLYLSYGKIDRGRSAQGKKKKNEKFLLFPFNPN